MRLFVDTSAWLAINDKDDQYHKKAVAKIAEIKNHKIELLTSEYVFDESITIIRHRITHKAAVIFGDSLLDSRIVTILDICSEDRSGAWELFKKYSDKDLSFTDCTSFLIMKKLRIQKAFSFDEHFKQVGFEIF